MGYRPKPDPVLRSIFQVILELIDKWHDPAGKILGRSGWKWSPRRRRA